MKAYTPYRVLSRVTLRWEDQDVKSVMVVLAGTVRVGRTRLPREVTARRVEKMKEMKREMRARPRPIGSRRYPSAVPFFSLPTIQ
jgi:hypothetical protein